MMMQRSIRNKKMMGDLTVGVSPLKHLMASILSWKMVSSHSITILAWFGLAPSFNSCLISVKYIIKMCILANYYLYMYFVYLVMWGSSSMQTV